MLFAFSPQAAGEAFDAPVVTVVVQGGPGTLNTALSASTLNPCHAYLRILMCVCVCVDGSHQSWFLTLAPARCSQGEDADCGCGRLWPSSRRAGICLQLHAQPAVRSALPGTHCRKASGLGPVMLHTHTHTDTRHFASRLQVALYVVHD